MSKGKGGGGGQNEQRINFESGYAAFKPGATAEGSTHPYYGGIVRADHPMFQYYQAGWNKAKQDYEAQQRETDMLLGLLQSQQEAEARAAADAASRQAEYAVMSNPNAKFEDVAKLAGDAYGYVWDPGAKYKDITGAWTPIDEETFNSLKEDRQSAIDKYPGIMTADNPSWSKTWKDALAGEAKRDEAYGKYMDTAQTAIQYVNDLVDVERSNAALLGIDYNLSDEEKQKRINDYFATIWSEADQKGLQDLIDKWGAPEGFTDWIVTRGSNPTTPQKGGSVLIGTSQGMPKKKKVSPSDQDTLAKSILLGA